MMIEIIILHTLKNIKHIYPYSFGYKIVCDYDKFSKNVVLYRENYAASRFT